MALHYAVAFVWGFCEATFFFIVPDVWLTWLVVQNSEKKRLWMAWGFAVAGASAGGLVLYVLAAGMPYDQVIEYLKHVPGIRQREVETVVRQVQELGVLSFFAGSFTGVPYKIYAAQWSHLNMSVAVLVGITILARGLRFLTSMILAGIVCAIGRRVSKRWEASKSAIFILVWLVFYVIYFSRHL